MAFLLCVFEEMEKKLCCHIATVGKAVFRAIILIFIATLRSAEVGDTFSSVHRFFLHRQSTRILLMTMV